mgnify:CR=1 FL=1
MSGGPIGRLDVPSGQRQYRHDAHRGPDAAPEEVGEPLGLVTRLLDGPGFGMGGESELLPIELNPGCVFPLVRRFAPPLRLNSEYRTTPDHDVVDVELVRREVVVDQRALGHEGHEALRHGQFGRPTLHVVHVLENPFAPGAFMEMYSPPPAQYFTDLEPGLGRLVFQGISSRDLIVVKSVVMILVVAVLVALLLAAGVAATREGAARQRQPQGASTRPWSTSGPQPSWRWGCPAPTPTV